MTSATLPLELKTKQVNTFSFRVQDTTFDALSEQLKQKVAQAPQFLTHAGVVATLDCKEAFDFHRLTRAVNEAGVRLVGVTGATAEQRRAANEAGLAVLSASERHTPSQRRQTPAPVLADTKVVRGPIRGGQQVYAADAHLVVMGPVSAGAELIADGSIHVYGALRGRAIAGAQGQQSARVFCQRQEAQLVAIAGHFWLADDLTELAWQQAASLYLDESGQLKAELL